MLKAKIGKNITIIKIHHLGFLQRSSAPSRADDYAGLSDAETITFGLDIFQIHRKISSVKSPIFYERSNYRRTSNPQ